LMGRTRLEDDIFDIISGHLATIARC
jgi:hypothetical protein